MTGGATARTAGDCPCSCVLSRAGGTVRIYRRFSVCHCSQAVAFLTQTDHPSATAHRPTRLAQESLHQPHSTTAQERCHTKPFARSVQALCAPRASLLRAARNSLARAAQHQLDARCRHQLGARFTLALSDNNRDPSVPQRVDYWLARRPPYPVTYSGSGSMGSLLPPVHTVSTASSRPERSCVPPTSR